jgi:hypothetical protein
MYLRITTGQAQPGKADELAARWKEHFSAQPAVPELRHRYFSVDRATDTIASVGIWDTEPDEAQLQGAIEAFTAKVSDLIATRPQVTTYEVLADL